MRFRSLLLPLFAFLLCTVASAQQMAGTYVSTNLDGSPLAVGYTVYIEIHHLCTDEDGTENYITQSVVVKDATGEVVREGNPGSLRWAPEVNVGQITGSIGTTGWLFDPLPGSGIFIADYSDVGGNVRAWTKL